jgi:hypothetical protein
MGCGCGGSMPVPLTVGWSDQRDTIRARAVMCGVCPEMVDGTCRLTGKGRRHMATAGGCPIGRHPDEGGVVRWLETDWLGVPAPVRWTWWLARRWLGLPALTGPLPGCGCHRALKDIWDRYARLLHLQPPVRPVRHGEREPHEVKEEHRGLLQSPPPPPESARPESPGTGTTGAERAEGQARTCSTTAPVGV